LKTQPINRSEDRLRERTIARSLAKGSAGLPPAIRPGASPSCQRGCEKASLPFGSKKFFMDEAGLCYRVFACDLGGVRASLGISLDGTQRGASASDYDSNFTCGGRREMVRSLRGGRGALLTCDETPGNCRERPQATDLLPRTRIAPTATCPTHRRSRLA
jgi:hypothetical protein